MLTHGGAPAAGSLSGSAHSPTCHASKRCWDASADAALGQGRGVGLLALVWMNSCLQHFPASAAVGSGSFFPD